MNEDITKTTDKISMFKTIVDKLVGRIDSFGSSNAVNESNLISCPDCQTY